MTYKKTREIAHDLLGRVGPEVPHRWVVGDDEFGRASEPRARLRRDGERHLLDVPRDTNVRDLGARRPPRRRAHGGVKRERPWIRVDGRARKLAADRWTRMTVRAGDEGPLEVEAVSAPARARHPRRAGPEERLLVIRTIDPKPDWTYSMSNAPPEVPLAELVRARSSRHRVEEVFEQAKGEVGPADYEARIWVGWHHHITLALLALWSLVLERRRLGGENPGGDGGADPGDLHRVAPQAPPDGAGDRRGGQSGLAA